MEDLYIGMAILAVGTLALAVGTTFACWRAPRWLLDVLGGVVILGIVAFVFVLRDGFWMARLLPYSNLVVVGNWLPLMAGVLTGLLLPRLKGRRSAQVLWAAALLLTAFYAILDPLRGKPPVCVNVWEEVCKACIVGGKAHETMYLCRQTSPVSCSPAAACTLLDFYGISVHEADMAHDCLTRNGTTWQGLYRGLKRAVREEQLEVEVFETDLETLVGTPGPKLLFVELKKGGDYDPRYEEKWGWIPGRRHTVVFYERSHPRARDTGDGSEAADVESVPLEEHRFLIGDPAVGLEEWSMTDMRTLWHGRGMRLVPR